MTEAEYLPFVRRVVSTVNRPVWVEWDDVVSEGCLALMDALGRYDQTRGASVRTFVERRVRGAVKDYLRRQDLSVHHRRYQKRKGRPEDPPARLDSRLARRLRARPVDYVTQLYALELLRRLPVRERRVVFEGFWRGRPHREIAPRLRVNASRISQLQTRALERMRAVA